MRKKDEVIKTEFNRYNNANVYKLISDVDDYFYIGSTCSSLTKRLHGHKRKAKIETERKIYKHFNSIEWDNVKIILMNEYYLDNKEQLLREEDIYIQMYKNDDFCLNSLRSFLCDGERKEYCKKYNKQYYEESKEQIKEKHKQYNNVKIKCCCGGNFTPCNKAKHNKTQKHLAWINDQKQTKAETV